MARKKAEIIEEPVKFTKYERARILGSRALQISMGAPYLIKLEKEKLEELKYNPLEIAKLEFEAGVIPITVIRPLPKVESIEKAAAAEKAAKAEKEKAAKEEKAEKDEE